MNTDPPPLPPPPRKPITLPLVLAFVPSAIGLVAFTGYAQGPPGAAFMISGCLVSIACCSMSSLMLIKRSTAAAVIFGILIGLFNVFICVGLGCASLLTGDPRALK